jgi:hypothetical protein
LIQAGGETRVLRPAIHKFINSIWNKEELPDQWKESIVVPVHIKVIKLTNNYRGISLVSTSFKMLPNIPFLKLSSYIDEIIRDHLQINYCSDILHSLDTGERIGVQ